MVVCGWLLPATACQRKPTDVKPNEPANLAVAEPPSLVRVKAAVPGVKFFAPGPARPLPTVELDPADLTTAAGQGSMHVLVANLGAPVGTDLLKQIAQSVVLKTWPAQAVVPTTVSKIVDATGKSNQDELAHIYLTPVSPLTDAWYALAIDVLPRGVAWASNATMFQPANGGRATRFRVGSGVVTSGVRVYTKDPGRQVVYVDFSEPVSADSKVGLSYSGGALPACQTDTSVAPAGSPSAASKDATGMTLPQGTPTVNNVASIRLSCAGGIDLSQQILVDVRLGGSQSNAATATLALAITPDSWGDLGDGGKMFKPTLP
jgi:hypothetical protein